MPKLHLHCTKSRKKEPVKPLENNHIKLYTCGPTVYDFAHIGNFRTYIFEDLLRRTLEFFDFKVTHVMNLTDVDDKTIKGAVRQGLSLDTYTEPFKKAFFEDSQTLNLLPAHKYPAATDHIVEMIAMIETLIKKELAYVGQDGSVYFRIASFPNYGHLSHLKLDELETGASERVFHDEYEKDTASDFVLWKTYDKERDGTVYWESPWGKGRPGWHIECSAMAIKHLGETIDIHCGGVDNMFPHHENEIAQSEGCTGKTFSRLWLHSKHLLVDGKKMSKSLGNFYTLRDLLEKGYDGRTVRYLLLGSHYRMPLNFTLEGLNGAKNSLKRLDDFVKRLSQVKEGTTSPKLKSLLDQTEARFKEGLADDLNIAISLAALFDCVRGVNQLIDEGALGHQGAEDTLILLRLLDRVLGVLKFSFDELTIPQEVEEALEKRNRARAEKNWCDADKHRDFIAAHGFKIVDTKEGSKLEPL